MGPSSRLPLARLVRYLPLRAGDPVEPTHLLPAQVTCPFLPCLPGPASAFPGSSPRRGRRGTFQQALESGGPSSRWPEPRGAHPSPCAALGRRDMLLRSEARDRTTPELPDCRRRAMWAGPRPSARSAGSCRWTSEKGRVRPLLGFPRATAGRRGPGTAPSGAPELPLPRWKHRLVCSHQDGYRTIP